jgi:hypothetical protein
MESLQKKRAIYKLVSGPNLFGILPILSIPYRKHAGNIIGIANRYLETAVCKTAF